LLVFADAEHPGDYTNHPTDRPAQNASDRSGGLVAFRGSLLNALNQPLRIRSRRPAEKQGDNGSKRKTQSHARRRSRTDHCLISMVDFDVMAGHS
jgi:hypothetical protein